MAALGEKRSVRREPLKTPRLKMREETKRVPPWVTA